MENTELNQNWKGRLRGTGETKRGFQAMDKTGRKRYLESFRLLSNTLNHL